MIKAMLFNKSITPYIRIILMILLSPVDSGKMLLDQAMFISTEMGKTLARELSVGRLQFNKKLVPVHLPYEGLLTLDYGADNHLTVEKNLWLSMGLPSLYQGELLSSKRLIVFPMHGLGDQIYLAVALRALAAQYPEMEVTLVKPSIESAEQWYPLIYFEPWYKTTGPVVNYDEMRGFDYYLDAEHFAHKSDYNGTYPPEFYLKYFFHHPLDILVEPVPRIVPFDNVHPPNQPEVLKAIQSMKQYGKPLVFVNSVSTGRVRDLPLKTLMEFLELSESRFSFLVSTFKRPDIETAVASLHLGHVKSTEGLITDIRDLCLIIKSCDLLITTDSGITHLAETLSVPCGSVFNVVTPEERIKHYRFSESLMVDFIMKDVCKTPCYFHALEEGDFCPGMAFINEKENMRLFYEYPPCVTHLEGKHLMLLLEALFNTYG